MMDTLVVVSGIREEVVTAEKKRWQRWRRRKEYGQWFRRRRKWRWCRQTTAATVGQRSAAETEAVLGQQQSTKTWQRLGTATLAPASVALVVVAAAAAAAAVVAATTTGADCSCGHHGHPPINSTYLP